MLQLEGDLIELKEEGKSSATPKFFLLGREGKKEVEIDYALQQQKVHARALPRMRPKGGR